jgi:hypothetical protein
MTDGEAGRKVFRRTGSAVFSGLLALVLVGLAAAITIRYESRDAIVAWAVCLFLAALAVVSGVLPRLVITATGVQVHNMFTTVDIPYPGVAEAVLGRRGLAIRTVGGRAIPVVGFGRSSLAEMLTGNAVARQAAAEVNARVGGGSHDSGESPPPPRRSLKIAEIVAVSATLVFAAAALWLGP